MSLGENIIRLRGEKNLSQEKLAIELGVSRQAISKWETDASVPELDKLLRMSEVFGVTLDALVKGDAPAEEVRSRNEVPPVQQTVIVERRGTPLRMTLGILLLCFGALLGLFLCLVATDILSVAFLVTPFLVSGVMALTVQKHALLWCGWVLLGYFGLTSRWMVGMNVSAPALLMMLFVLCPCTVLAFQKRKK